MSKEKASPPKAATAKASPTNATLAVFLNADLYKRSQGRIIRQITGAALAATVLLGAWSLSQHFAGSTMSIRAGVPAIVVAVGLWLSFRVVNLPKFADFLIATEAEMNKVSWPSRTELIRGSTVVLVTIFALAALLFAYDFFWRTLLSLLGVLPGSNE